MSQIKHLASIRCLFLDVAAIETIRLQAIVICKQLTCMIICLHCLLEIISLTLLPGEAYQPLPLLKTAR